MDLLQFLARLHSEQYNCWSSWHILPVTLFVGVSVRGSHFVGESTSDHNYLQFEFLIFFFSFTDLIDHWLSQVYLWHFLCWTHVTLSNYSRNWMFPTFRKGNHLRCLLFWWLFIIKLYNFEWMAKVINFLTKLLYLCRHLSVGFPEVMKLPYFRQIFLCMRSCDFIPFVELHLLFEFFVLFQYF